MDVAPCREEGSPADCARRLTVEVVVALVTAVARAAVVATGLPC